jgi:hypothetical protein
VDGLQVQDDERSPAYCRALMLLTVQLMTPLITASVQAGSQYNRMLGVVFGCAGGTARVCVVAGWPGASRQGVGKNRWQVAGHIGSRLFSTTVRNACAVTCIGIQVGWQRARRGVCVIEKGACDVVGPSPQQDCLLGRHALCLQVAGKPSSKLRLPDIVMCS